jgi:hypothetical protein
MTAEIDAFHAQDVIAAAAAAGGAGIMIEQVDQPFVVKAALGMLTGACMRKGIALRSAFSR